MSHKVQFFGSHPIPVFTCLNGQLKDKWSSQQIGWAFGLATAAATSFGYVTRPAPMLGALPITVAQREPEELSSITNKRANTHSRYPLWVNSDRNASESLETSHYG
jgi:hypothetical protein